MLSTNSQYLALQSNPVIFDPVSSMNSVFFDEANNQIFTVRSGGATGVVVRGPEDASNSSFELDAKGSPISIKFSYRHQFLAIQRSETFIEFFLVVDGRPGETKYTQSSRVQGSKIVTFHWVSSCEFVVVTDGGVEFYQINQSKKEIRLLKNYSLPITWSIFLADGALLLCYTPTKGGLLCPFQFKDSKMWRMSAFVPDYVAQGKSGQSSSIHEKDVRVVRIYDELYVAVLRHSTAANDSSTLIELYLISRDPPVQKKFILMSKVQGRFAMSVVDNLFVIHHQASKSSMIFDIRLPGTKSGSVTHVQPVVMPMPIQSQKIQVTGFSLSQPRNEVECQMYAGTWIVFQPNIIIDAALGYMWFLEIKLDAITSLFNDLGRLIDFLLLRQGSKSVILKVLKKTLASRRVSPSYGDIGKVFDKLNGIYKKSLEAKQAYVKARQKHDAPASSERSLFHTSHGMNLIVDESDMYTHVLSVIANEEGVDHKHIKCVAIEYIRSLNDHQLVPQDYLFELVIRALVMSKDYYALEQYVCSGIIPGSKSTTKCLISIISKYPDASEIAVDLWKRIPNCGDELVDALLTRRKVLDALRFVRASAMQNTVSARKFLEVAKETGDDMLFYETYKYFESRNFSLRGDTKFTPGEQCETFVKYHEEKFKSFERSARV